MLLLNCRNSLAFESQRSIRILFFMGKGNVCSIYDDVILGTKRADENMKEVMENQRNESIAILYSNDWNEFLNSSADCFECK